LSVHLETVRDIVVEHGRISADPSELALTSDLYAAGLTSLTTVHVMLALEDHFDVEFPDNLLSRQTFESLQSICEAVEELVD
jgi:acyl carrier protein